MPNDEAVRDHRRGIGMKSIHAADIIAAYQALSAALASFSFAPIPRKLEK